MMQIEEQQLPEGLARAAGREEAHRFLQRGISIKFAGPTHDALFLLRSRTFLFHFRNSRLLVRKAAI
jgi:hypothetical protein